MVFGLEVLRVSAERLGGDGQWEVGFIGLEFREGLLGDRFGDNQERVVIKFLVVFFKGFIFCFR